MDPLISIILCTYNGEKLINNCLDSILKQNISDFEVLCVDGGSTDKTKEIIKEYSKKDSRIILLNNKKKLPEGKGYGKWSGYEKSKGKIIGIIDQDNILQRNDLFFQVNNVLKKNKNVLGVLGKLHYDQKDSKIVKYVALTGTDSFLAYRSIDFLINYKTFESETLNSEIFEKITLNSDNLFITGGNCFFYDKKKLEKIGGYTQDILVINELVKLGVNDLFVINNSTKHYAEKSLFNLIKKKFKWGKEFNQDSGRKKFDYFPKTQRERKEFYKNLFFNLTILPNFFKAFTLYRNSKQSISFLFPFIAFLNTLAYTMSYLFHKQRRLV